MRRWYDTRKSVDAPTWCDDASSAFSWAEGWNAAVQAFTDEFRENSARETRQPTMPLIIVTEE